MAPPFLPPAAELLREHIERLRPEVDWTVELWEGRRSLVRGGRLWAWEEGGAVVLGIGEPNPTEPLFAVMVSASDEAKTQALRGELPWWRVDGSVRLADPGVWARWVPMARSPIVRLVQQGAVLGDRRIRIPCHARVWPPVVDLLVAFVLLEHWHPVEQTAPAWAVDPPDSDAAAIDAWLRSLRGRRRVESPFEVEPWRRALQDEALARAHLLTRLDGMQEALLTKLVREAAKPRCGDVLLRVPLTLSVVKAWARQKLDGMLVARLAEASEGRLWAAWLLRAWRHDPTRARAVLELHDLGVDLGATEFLRGLEEEPLSGGTRAYRGLGRWLLDRARPTDPDGKAAFARVLLKLPWEATEIVAATDWVGEAAVAGVLLDAVEAASELPTRSEGARLRAAQARVLAVIEMDSKAVAVLLRQVPRVAPWLELGRASMWLQCAQLDALEASRLPADPALLDLVERTENEEVRLRAVSLLGQTGGAVAYRRLQALASQWFLPRPLARGYRVALAQIQDRTRTGALSLAEPAARGGLAVADE